MNALSAHLSIRWTLVWGIAVALVTATLAVASPSQAQKVRPDFFGMHDNQITNGGVPTVDTGSTRLWDVGVTWREIETLPGVFDLTKTTQAVATAKAAGLRPLLVLGQTPRFHATDDPETYEAYGNGATSMPRMAAWKDYVGKVARVYGDQIEYQIWNEANVLNYWSGSVRQMVRLTVAASKVITNVVGKKAIIVAPAFALRLAGQRAWYKQYWSQKVGGKSIAALVDVVAVNPYPLPDKGPEGSQALIGYAKQVLPRAAKRKPMWNVEINYGLAQGGTGESRDIPDGKQAAFVARTLLLNAGSGIRRVYWYSWALPLGNTRLVENDRSTLTRAGRAWQQVHGWMVGTDLKGCTTDRRGRTKGLYTCVAKVGRNEVRRFYWKPSGTSAVVRTHRTTSSWTDLSGETKNRQGSVRIEVGPSPVMVTSRD